MGLPIALAAVLGIALVSAGGFAIERAMDGIYRVVGESAAVASLAIPLLTSVPELAIFVEALASGSADVAWGTAVAEPFLMGTLVYPLLALSAAVAWIAGRRTGWRLRGDRWIVLPLLLTALPLLPVIALGGSLVGIVGRAYGIALMAAFFLYATRAAASKVDVGRRASGPGLLVTASLIAAAIASFYFGGELLVGAIDGLTMSHVAASILLVPLATVLPESTVAMVLVTRGRDLEGLAIVAGEGVLYGTFYPGVSILVGAFSFSPASTSAIAISMALSTGGGLLALRRRFWAITPLGPLLYAAYVMAFAL